VFEGLNHTSYRVDYSENPDCMSHHTLERVVSLPVRSTDWTLRQLRERAQQDLAAQDVTIEFSRDVIHKLVCPQCGAEEEPFAALGSLSFEKGRCSKDGAMRIVKTVHGFSGVESYGTRTLDQLGLPLFDLFTARTSEHEIGYL